MAATASARTSMRRSYPILRAPGRVDMKSGRKAIDRPTVRAYPWTCAGSRRQLDSIQGGDMTVLVTGATGRSGSAVVRELVRRQRPVRALVRSRARAAWLEALPGVEAVEGDMIRPETLGAALDGVERALMISSPGPLLLETQCTFIDAALAAGVGHLVKFSGEDSIVGFDPGRFRSTRSHEQVERYLKASGLAWTTLRPSQFMQVYLEEAPAVAAEGLLRLPLGETRLAPVDIQDIAQVAAALLGGEGEPSRAYRMTGPESLSMAEAAEWISAAVGGKVSYLDVTSDQKRRE